MSNPLSKSMCLRVLIATLAATAMVARLAAEPTGALESAPTVAQQPLSEGINEPALHLDTDPLKPIPDAAPIHPAKSDNEFLVAPIPSYDPSQGWGIKLMAEYIFHPTGQDANARPSIIGLGGFYTEEKSWGFMGGYMGHFKQDRWRVVLGAGYMNFNYDYYGNGNASAERDISVPINQRAGGVYGRVMYRIIPNLYIGFGLIASDTKLKVDLTLPYPVPVDLPSKRAQYIGTPMLQWDSRDNQFYPTKGTLANIKMGFCEGDYSYAKVEFDWNNYQAIKAIPGAVIASRVTARYVTEDAPFFALSQFGTQNDLRGYKSGKYRDNALVAAQVEWRQQLTKRWIVAAFGGLGEVEPRIADLKADDVLGSVGAGIRYRLGRKNPVSIRLDWAYGKDGDAWYFSVGEAY